MKVHNRVVVLSMVGGSVNRNLHDETSDRDEKYFVLPTFEDLYTNTVYKNMDVSDTVDTEVHDVRRLDKLLFQSNLTYVELLYSVELNTHGYKEMEQLVSMREELAQMNLQNFFGSCLGMFNRQFDDMTNPNSPKQVKVIEQYGYNPKKGMMCKHFLNVLEQYHQQNFQDFGSCLWYEGEKQEFMMKMKRGEFSLGEVSDMLQTQEQRVRKLKDVYYQQPFQTETHDKLKELVRLVVKNHLKETL